MEHRIGAIGIAAPDRQFAALRRGNEALLADHEADPAGEGGTGLAIEHGAQGPHQRDRRERQAWIMRGGLRGPAAELLNQRLGGEPPRGELVDLRLARRRQHPADDHARGLERGQPLGQHLGRNAGEAGAQVGKPPRPQHQLAHHQQGPALPDHFEPEGRAAGVVIPAPVPCRGG